MLLRTIGDIGENYTAKYLKSNGFKILERNFSCKMGEIDIIAQKGETLHFVEVKSRKPGAVTSGQSAINYSKQGKIVKAAKYYILNNSIQLNAVFDSAIVEINNRTVTGFEYIERSFTA